MILAALTMLLCLPVACARQKKPPPQLQPGDEAMLYDTTGDIPVARGPRTLEKWLRALKENNETSKSQLLNGGSVFLARSGTRVELGPMGNAATRIKILDGEHRGKHGYVPYRKVSRLPGSGK